MRSDKSHNMYPILYEEQCENNYIIAHFEKYLKQDGAIRGNEQAAPEASMRTAQIYSR